MGHSELRRRVNGVLSSHDSRAGQVVDIIVAALILSICALSVVEYSVADPGAREVLWRVEQGITVIFLLEYLIRWWAQGFSLRYPFRPLAIVDLLAVFLCHNSIGIL